MAVGPAIEEERAYGAFRAVLARGDFEAARAHCEGLLADPGIERWLVTSMLEDLGLRLAHAERFDESIATFERAIELGWDVVPDGRCEIARVLLLAGRHLEADALWEELRKADPEGVWTLNAGGMAYNEVGRFDEALEWLTSGLRLELDREDAERIVGQLSDARRVALRELGLERDALEAEVEAFRRHAAEGEERQLAEIRAAARTAGIPVQGRSMTIAWVGPEADAVARERWPRWGESLIADAPFGELAERMERRLRERRADGDGPLQIVTIDLDAYADWCERNGHDPADRASRAMFVHEPQEGEGRRWPPGRNEPCWCGSARKYKRCCGALR